MNCDIRGKDVANWKLLYPKVGPNTFLTVLKISIECLNSFQLRLPSSGFLQVYFVVFEAIESKHGTLIEHGKSYQKKFCLNIYVPSYHSP